jgi:hypothetical protein
MEMPGLKTRAQNKLTRPAVAAGLEKGTRRTAAQMQQAREAEKKKVDKAALHQQKALERLAAVEDKQLEEDIAYAETANHPVDRPLKKPAEKAQRPRRRG